MLSIFISDVTNIIVIGRIVKKSLKLDISIQQHLIKIYEDFNEYVKTNIKSRPSVSTIKCNKLLYCFADGITNDQIAPIFIPLNNNDEESELSDDTLIHDDFENNKNNTNKEINEINSNKKEKTQTEKLQQQQRAVKNKTVNVKKTNTNPKYQKQMERKEKKDREHQEKEKQKQMKNKNETQTKTKISEKQKQVKRKIDEIYEETKIIGGAKKKRKVIKKKGGKKSITKINNTNEKNKDRTKFLEKLTKQEIIQRFQKSIKMLEDANIEDDTIEQELFF